MPSLSPLRARRASVALVLAGWLLAAPALAGQGQEASIIGQVTDQSGAALPGVTVTATSPSLQVPSVIAVTNERGEYRISPLPIGTYDVTYTLGGFQPIKQADIRLTVGFTAKLDVSLKVGAVEESVTVSGASPVIDVTSTRATTQLTRETLELIPTTRNGITSVLAQAPGLRGIIDIGGANFSAIPDYSGYGQTGEYWATLDGVLVTNPNSGGAAGGYTDYSTFEETRVGGIGKGAEVPVRGASLDAIIKSGSNTFHGSGFYSGTSSRFQGDNLDDSLRNFGLTNPPNQTEWDASLDLGGRIIRDKLWFYVAGRQRSLDQDIPGAYQFAGGPVAIHTQKQEYHTEKLSFQASRGNRFVIFNQHALKREIANDVTLNTPWDSRTSSDVPTATKKVDWQGVHGNVMATVLFGNNWWEANYYGHSTDQSTTDQTSLLNTGDSTNHSYYHVNRYQTSATVTWYKADGFLGNHEVKTGFDYLAECCGLSGKLRSNEIPGIGDYQLIFKTTNGVPHSPFEIAIYNNPVDPINKVRYLSQYVADNWTIARRLTLNLGARFEHVAGYVDKQCRVDGPFAPAACIDRIDFNTWNTVTPRASFAYQLTGDGKTVIKGGFGIYNHKYFLQDVNIANPFQQVTTTYLWHDLNHDNLYDPGEVNLALGPPDYVTQAGSAQAVPDPKEPQPRESQTFLTFERELIRNLSVRVTGVYSVYYNVPVRVYVNRPYEAYNVPVTNLIPGLDGKASSGPGTSITFFEYPQAYVGKQFDTYMRTSLPSLPNETFKTIEMSAAKRMSQRWQFLASYSATRKNIPFPENSFYSPNMFINNSDQNWDWIGRVSGAYQLPHGVTVSANMENRSGTVATTTARFTNGTTIPSMLLNIAPVGSASYPAIHDLDLRAEKTFTLAGRHKFTARLNLYNTFNTNAVASWTTQVGSKYLQPSVLLPPRIFEVSATYAF